MPVVPPLVCSTSGMRAPSAGEMPMKSPNGGKRSMLSRRCADVVRRHFLQVVQAADVAGLETGALPMPLEERNLPSALHRRQEAFFLPRAQLHRAKASPSSGSNWAAAG